jgi:F-type H+-transporting ATPase subunit b
MQQLAVALAYALPALGAAIGIGVIGNGALNACLSRTVTVSLFSSLGINWQTLIIQVIGFVILVWAVAKWVVPVLLKSVDARQKAIDDSLKAAQEANKKLAEADDAAANRLREARTQASQILSTAKDEATAAIDGARDKARSEAERIVKDAHEQMSRDIDSARTMLRNETIDLVANATERIAGVKLDAKTDARTIETALSSASTTPFEEVT